MKWQSDQTAITPAALSLHSAGLAVDVNWNQLNPPQRTSVLDAASKAGLSWGGDFSHPGPVHFYNDPGIDRQRLIADFNQSIGRLKSDR